MQLKTTYKMRSLCVFYFVLVVSTTTGSGCDRTGDADDGSDLSYSSVFDLSTLELTHDMGSDKVQKVVELAERGDAAGAFTLGLMYENGLGVSQSDKSMIFWMSRAADDGLAAAYTMLGIYSLQGKGVEKDVDKAIAYFDIAGRAGDPIALHELGKLYLTNEFGRRQQDRAFFLIRESALRGYPKAQIKLGSMWEIGEGTSRNLSRAINWLKRAAESGLKQAEKELKRISNEYREFEWDDNVYFVERVVECGQMRISGELSSGLVDAVRKKYDEGISEVILESPGGLLKEGIALGKFIRENGLNVFSGYTCASACAIAFLSGKQRYISPNVEIAFHGPRFAFSDSNFNETNALESYLTELPNEIDQDFVQRVFGEDESFLATTTELLEHGIASGLVPSESREVDCIFACIQAHSHSYNDFRQHWCAAQCGKRCEDYPKH